MITLDEIAERMVDRLMERAREEEVDLKGVNRKNFNSELDKRFGDGGEARCEHFADVAWEYSLQFGKLESKGFEKAQWDAITAGLDLLEKRLEE